jgi:hypothetical protein
MGAEVRAEIGSSDDGKVPITLSLSFIGATGMAAAQGTWRKAVPQSYCSAASRDSAN